MALWHRSWWADGALRLLGAGLCGLAGLATLQLVARMAAPGAPDARAYALAGLGFIAASAGATLVALGRRLFDPPDPIVAGGRWRAATHHAFRPPSETIMTLDLSHAARPLPQQDSDGSGTARDATAPRARVTEAARRFTQGGTAAPGPSVPLPRIPGRLSLRIGGAEGGRPGA